MAQILKKTLGSRCYRSSQSNTIQTSSYLTDRALPQPLCATWLLLLHNEQILRAGRLYTLPVDADEESLPSPEQLKGKVIVKVSIRLCIYITYISIYTGIYV